MPVCTVCSGTEFFDESGFYYCAECQTQSQDSRIEVVERDLWTEDDDTNIRKKKKGSTAESVDSSDLDAGITSWEVFNIALVGLVDELINLGVKRSFKEAMLWLWSSYLRRMEVAFFSSSHSTLPKLGPNFKKNDAKLIYGYGLEEKSRARRRRRDESVGNVSNETHSHTSIQGQRNMQKIAHQRNYENYEKIMQEMSSASQTLTDVTLDMLSNSDCSDDPKELQFNEDFRRLESTGQDPSKLSLGSHPGLMVRNKLISLIFLGLIITGEEMKLSDLLRSISERHVSYSNLGRFFSELKPVQRVHIYGILRYQPTPSYANVLQSTAQLANYLKLSSFSAPSLRSFIDHYCKELNLPSQVRLLAQRLLALLPHPKDFIPSSKNTCLVNWEGRAMAHIIIALKLLFGLDDATEQRNSKIARKFNELMESGKESLRLFVWNDWVQFCTLRRTTLMLFHEPSYLKAKDVPSMIQNIKPLISGYDDSCHINPFTCTPDREVRLATLRSEIFQDIVTKLKSNNTPSKNDGNQITFPFTASPYTCYVELISRAIQEGKISGDTHEWKQVINELNIEMLNQNFFHHTVDYLTHPKEYITWAQQHGLRIGLHYGAAVPAIVTPKEENTLPSRAQCYSSRFRVKVYLDQVSNLPSSSAPLAGKSQSNLQLRGGDTHRPVILPQTSSSKGNSPLPHISDMQMEEPSYSLIGRPKKEQKSTRRSTFAPLELLKDDEDDMLHIPHTEYWMLHFQSEDTAIELPKEANRLPLSFLFLLEECSSLLQMSAGSLYNEVVYVEKLHQELVKNLSPSDDEKDTPKNAHLAEQLKMMW